MKYIAVPVLCAILALPTLAKSAQCDVNASQLMASYQIKQLGEHGRFDLTKMELYRLDNQVGHYFPEQDYGDWWSLTVDNHVLLSRYFPQYQRAVEYQADQIKGAKRYKRLWQKKWQLISSKLLSKMTVTGVEGQGCHQVELLEFSDKGKSYKARWLPRLRLIERLDISKGARLLTSWRLKDIESRPEIIRNYAAVIQAFRASDFADISHDESNAFIAKMVKYVSKPELD